MTMSMASWRRLFTVIVLVMVVYGVLACIRALRDPHDTALEIGAMAATGDD